MTRISSSQATISGELRQRRNEPGFHTADNPHVSLFDAETGEVLFEVPIQDTANGNLSVARAEALALHLMEAARNFEYVPGARNAVQRYVLRTSGQHGLRTSGVIRLPYRVAFDANGAVTAAEWCSRLP